MVEWRTDVAPTDLGLIGVVMPEMIEVEYYRRVAERTVGRTVRAVVAPDDWYLKGDTTARALRATVAGRTVTGTRRIGKLLLLDTDGPTLGLRFGMTGRLLVDGAGPDREARVLERAGRPDLDPLRPALRRRRRPAAWSTPAASAACSSTRTPATSAIDALAVKPAALPRRPGDQPGAAEGLAARPGPRRRHRQPAGRRDPVAGRARPRPTRALAGPRRGHAACTGRCVAPSGC